MKIITVFCVFILMLGARPTHGQVSEPLLQAIIHTESRNQTLAESRDGCRGLGQIEKRTWHWVCRQLGVSWSFDDAFDPDKNLQVTRFYLAWLEQYLKKNNRYSLELLCASYNAGPGAVRKHGWNIPPYRETQQYVQKIKKKLAEAATQANAG